MAADDPSELADPLDTLDKAATLHLLSFVTHVELCRLARTSRRWRAFIDGNLEVWRDCFDRTWEDAGIVARGTVNWRKVFVKQWAVEANWRSGMAVKGTLKRKSPKSKCPVTAMALLGRFLFATSSADNVVLQCDLDSREWTNDFTGHSKTVVGIATSATELLTASADRRLTVWDVASGLMRMYAEPHRKAITCLAQYRQLLATGSEDKTAAVLDRRNMATAVEPVLFRTPKLPKAVTAVALLSESRLAVGLESGALSVWGVTRKPAAEQIPQRAIADAHRGAITALKFSACNDLLASAGADGFIRLWGGSSGRLVTEMVAREGAAVRGLAISNLKLMSFGDDETVTLWDWQGRRITQLFPGFAVLCGVLDDRAACLAVGGAQDGSIVTYEFDTAAQRLPAERFHNVDLA